MGKGENITLETMARKRGPETNYRIRFVIGKTKERSTVTDGRGYAKSEGEAKEMFESVRKKTANILESELYFNDKLIEKR